MKTIVDYLPVNAEIGVGLALLNERDEYLFFLPGTRHATSINETFYAGIGGHLEANEDLFACGRREAMEEIGVPIHYEDSYTETVYISANKTITPIAIDEKIKPVGLYEMIHPPESPKAGRIYHLVIFQARVLSPLKRFRLKLDEVSGIITLTKEQVKRGIKRKATLRELIEEGAKIFGPGEWMDKLERKLYPIGTAEALAYIWNAADR